MRFLPIKGALNLELATEIKALRIDFLVNWAVGVAMHACMHDRATLIIFPLVLFTNRRKTIK